MATNTETNLVTISAERLRELEKLEAELPKLLEKAKEEAHSERLVMLRERDKANPDAHKQSSTIFQRA